MAPRTRPADPAPEFRPDPTAQMLAQIVALAVEVEQLRAQLRSGGGHDAEAAREDDGRLVLAVLAGGKPAAALPPGPLRDAVDRAAALRERLAAAEATPPADARAGAQQVARVVRLVEQVAETGVVPDDLGAGPLRDAVALVASLRQSIAAAEDRAAKARAETLAAQEAAKRHHDELQRVKAAPPPDLAELRKRAGDLEREVKAVRLVKDRQEAELTDRTRAVERLEDQVRALREGLAAVAVALGLPADAAAGQIVEAARERSAASAAPPAPTGPALEPPLMREAAWGELRSGDLALDRAALRRLNEHHKSGVEPSDPERRVLALRVGDYVAWLRGDGLWADETPFEEGPRARAGKFRDWLSKRAIVIAEGVTGDPGEVASAFRAWVEAARACPGLEAARDDEPAAAAAE